MSVLWIYEPLWCAQQHTVNADRKQQKNGVTCQIKGTCTFRYAYQASAALLSSLCCHLILSTHQQHQHVYHHFHRLKCWCSAFTALHRMQTRSSDESSVRLSNAWIVTKRKKICPDFYTTRKIIWPSFLRKRMAGGGRLLLPEILGQPAPVGAISPILNR